MSDDPGPRRLLPCETAALRVVEALRGLGHEALYAGGSVRDMLLGRTPNDVDVATSATPDEVERAFRRTIPVGRQFGIIVVLDPLLRDARTEVATFRADGLYEDGRRPTSVHFTTAEQDARRRDFAINGLFYDPLEGRVLDFVDGGRDLVHGVVRAIGDPEARFAEDRLRILRAPRFAASLGFTIDPATADSARLHAAQVATQVSPERIKVELGKLLAASTRARGLRLCDELGLIPHVLPEAGADVARVVRALDALPPEVEETTAWATALHLVGADAAEQAMVRLRASVRERDRVAAIVDGLATARGLAERPVAAQKRFVRRPEVPEVKEVLRAASIAEGGDLEAWRFLAARARAFAADTSPAALAGPVLIRGADLQAAGLRPGRHFAPTLAETEDAQLEGRVTDRASALAFALERARVHGG